MWALGSVCGMPVGVGPGIHDRFDPWDLDDVRDRIVLPVVHSLFGPDELTRVEVDLRAGVRPVKPALPRACRSLVHESHPSHGSAATNLPDPWEELWALVTVLRRTWKGAIWTIDGVAPEDTLDDIAFALADRLEDWSCENVFWGEQRIANYTIPARHRSP